MATNKDRVVFYVSGDVKERLAKLAQLDRRSLSNWLEKLAIETLENSEAQQQQDTENFKTPIVA